MLNERKFRKYKATKKASRLADADKALLHEANRENAVQRKRVAKMLTDRAKYDSRAEWSAQAAIVQGHQAAGHKKTEDQKHGKCKSLVLKK